MALVDDAMWQAFDLLDFTEKGAWPVANGTLNQTASFLEFVRCARSEEGRVRAEQDRRMRGQQ